MDVRLDIDALGRTWRRHRRTTRTILSDTSESSFSYSGLSTITTNAKSQKSRELRNALGQVIQTTQANPTTPSTLGMSVDMAYDAFGNLLSVSRNADYGLIVTTHEYDALGRRTKTVDPDRGTERAYYNAAGEVIRTVDGAGMEVGLDIDALGRVWRRKSGTHSSTSQPIADRIFGNGFEEGTLPTPGAITDLWVFDTATNGRGQLHYEERTADALPTFRKTMAYDTKGRPVTRSTLLDASTYTETWHYDTTPASPLPRSPPDAGRWRTGSEGWRSPPHRQTPARPHPMAGIAGRAQPGFSLRQAGGEFRMAHRPARK